MTTLTIPDDTYRRLAEQAAGLRLTVEALLDRLAADGPAAVERLVLAGYRDGTLSRYQVQRLLGFDNRWDTEEWLGSRGAVMQYSLADLDQDRATLDRVLGR